MEREKIVMVILPLRELALISGREGVGLCGLSRILLWYFGGSLGDSSLVFTWGGREKVSPCGQFA